MTRYKFWRIVLHFVLYTKQWRVESQSIKTNTSKVSTKPQYLATEHLNNVLRVHYVRRKRTNDSKTYCDEVVGKVPTEKY